MLPVNSCLTYSTGIGTGYIFLIAFSHSPNSIGLFIAYRILTVTLAALLLAFNYIIYGRLITSSVDPRHSFIQPQTVAKTFILVDLITFQAQVSSA